MHSESYVYIERLKHFGCEKKQLAQTFQFNIILLCATFLKTMLNESRIPKLIPFAGQFGRMEAQHQHLFTLLLRCAY